MPREQRAALKPAPRGRGQQATAGPPLQAAAVEKARRDSGNDSEWMAIGQQVPEGRQVQAGAHDAAALVGCDSLS